MAENEVNKEYLDALHQRLNQNNQDVEAAVNLGNYFFDQQLSSQALVYYGIALKLNPDQPGVKTDMGTMYWSNGIFSYAEIMFKEVIEQHPGFGNAYLNLGLLYRNIKKEPLQAIKIWKELVEGYPQDAAVASVQKLLSEAVIEIN